MTLLGGFCPECSGDGSADERQRELSRLGAARARRLLAQHDVEDRGVENNVELRNRVRTPRLVVKFASLDCKLAGDRRAQLLRYQAGRRSAIDLRVIAFDLGRVGGCIGDLVKWVFPGCLARRCNRRTWSGLVAIPAAC